MIKPYRGYIRAVIRDYPRLAKSAKLSRSERKRRDAVAAALVDLAPLPDAPERLRVIDLVYFDGRYNIAGAAMKCHVSERTAERWQAQFVRSVAVKLGLDDE